MWYGDGWANAGWGWFPLIHMLWWVIVLVAVVALIRWGLGGVTRGRDDVSARAIEILAERYARGEIDKEEYEERKRVIKG